MPVNQIDQILLKKMFLAGAANLDANKEMINELLIEQNRRIKEVFGTDMPLDCSEE